MNCPIIRQVFKPSSGLACHGIPQNLKCGERKTIKPWTIQFILFLFPLMSNTTCFFFILSSLFLFIGRMNRVRSCSTLPETTKRWSLLEVLLLQLLGYSREIELIQCQVKNWAVIWPWMVWRARAYATSSRRFVACCWSGWEIEN